MGAVLTSKNRPFKLNFSQQPMAKALECSQGFDLLLFKIVEVSHQRTHTSPSPWGEK